MLKIGEKYVYGTVGVVELVDVREETVLGQTRKYYVLRAKGAQDSSLTFVPCDSELARRELRPLLARAELTEMIREAKARPTDEWIPDAKRRTERFRSVIASGDRSELVSLIGAIYREGKRRALEGKRNFLQDESAMKRAEHILYSEISEVFSIPEADVPELIRKL